MAEKQTDTEANRNTVDMPRPGETVLWHRTGRRESDPQIVVAIKADGRNMIRINTLNPVHGSVFLKRGVPHISDPRLQNGEYAKGIGAWELTEYGVEMRTFAQRLAAVESACGVVVPKRSSVKP